VRIFCQDIIEASKRWLADMRDNTHVQKNMEEALEVNERSFSIGGAIGFNFNSEDNSASGDYFSNEGDLVEQLYGDKICSAFPNYYNFWNAFINQPDLKSNISPILYNKVASLHYSIFFSLAAAHLHLEYLRTNKRNTKEDSFRLLEFVETFYMHLGNVNNRLQKLWEVIKVITKYSKANIWTYLDKKDKGLLREAKKIKDTVIKLRNIIVHGSQILSWIDQDSKNLYLPDPQYINTDNENSWEELKKLKPLQIDIVQRAEGDLKGVEQVVNKIQQFAIEEIQKILPDKKLNPVDVPIKKSSPLSRASAVDYFDLDTTGISTIDSSSIASGSCVMPMPPIKKKGAEFRGHHI